MNEQQNMELKFKLNRLVEIWRGFCEMHTSLYEYTCDEYMHLLASEIDELNDTVQLKLKLLEKINLLDAQRTETTNEILTALNINDEQKKISQLLSTLREHNEVEVAKQIESMNLILLDIIEKIQEQNKKNQVFLNKAIHSLQDLRENFMGKAKYKTYSSAGTARSSNTL